MKVIGSNVVVVERMILGGRSLDDISLDDIQLLIDNKVPEGLHLEYKEAPYRNRSQDRREMLRDITALANADGGYLILGIHEDSVGRILSGPHANRVFELPDYEAGAYCGANFDIDDINQIPYLADMLDVWGLDVISGANVLGWATELHERGILSTADLDGIDLKWGDPDAYIAMIPKLATRDGIGDTLAEGTYAAANKMGQDSLQYAVQVKAIELGAHGVRSGQDYSKDPILYAINTQGGDHTSIAYPTSEMWYLEDTWTICGFLERRRDG